LGDRLTVVGWLRWLLCSHVMYVKMFAPKSSSVFQSISATMFGTPPEFNNPKFATTGEARSGAASL
jgi:hypothetical protein